MVLADVGGEPLKNQMVQLQHAIPDGKLTAFWNQQIWDLELPTLAEGKWANSQLGLSGKKLSRESKLTSRLADVCTFLMFAGLSTQAQDLPEWVARKCLLGSFLGRKTELSRFIRERYIWVSRITGGATANDFGQAVQAKVKSHLIAALPLWDFSRSTLEGASQNAGRTDRILEPQTQTADPRKQVGHAQSRRRAVHRLA